VDDQLEGDPAGFFDAGHVTVDVDAVDGRIRVVGAEDNGVFAVFGFGEDEFNFFHRMRWGSRFRAGDEPGKRWHHLLKR